MTNRLVVSGPASKSATFQLFASNDLRARDLRNIIKTLELLAEFMDEQPECVEQTVSEESHD